MEVVILCGGRGSRLGHLTVSRPKPLVMVGGTPIVCHIMRWYASFGFSRFTLCLGYRSGDFLDWFSRQDGVRLENRDTSAVVHTIEGWRVRLADTGAATMTGGRLRRVAFWLRDEPNFLLTYGDAVADVDLRELADLHVASNALVTMTLVHPSPRFGIVELADGTGARDPSLVTAFVEKPIDERWINGGYFVVRREVLDRFHHDDNVLETDLLARLAGEGVLRGYRHEGFWQCVDTPSDLIALEAFWARGAVPGSPRWTITRLES